MLTVFSHVSDPQGIAVACDWATLPEVLRALPPHSLFACASFADDYHALAAYNYSTAIVLDHDGATVPMTAAVEALKGVASYVYATKTPGRWRAIVRTADTLTEDAYRREARALALALSCAPESARPSQLWFPPAGDIITVEGEPLRVDSSAPLAAVDTEARLSAWIKGDYTSPAVAEDLPRKPDGTPDRSAIDCAITHRLLALGATDERIAEVLTSRGALSHRTDAQYIETTLAKVKGRQTAALAEAREVWGVNPSVDVPTILVDAALSRVTDEALQALAADDTIYNRDGSLVALALDPPRAVRLSAVTVRERLSRVAIFARATKEGFKRVPPPEDTAKAIVDRADREALRPLRGISETPIVRPDGTIATEAGYDPVTGYYCVGTTRITQAVAPTQEDARNALASLRVLFAEFPFEQEAMRDVPIAAIIAVACRPAVGANVPLFAFDAPAQGSGKSLLTEVISLITTGGVGAKTPFPREAAEQTKVLAGYAINGAPIINFDNVGVGTVVSGETLDAVLTSGGRVAFRVLGESRIVFCAWSSVITINGNQLTIAGDTRRRTVRCRIVPMVDSPAGRTFALDLPSYCLTHRARLLGDAITILRAYILAGKPLQGSGATRGSFVDFVSTVVHAIQWAGGVDIRDAWREETQHDDSREAMLAIHEWFVLRWPEGVTASAFVDDLGGEGWLASATSSALFAADPALEARVREALSYVCERSRGTKRQAFAYALRAWRDVYANGRKLKGAEGRHTKWRLE